MEQDYAITEPILAALRHIEWREKRDGHPSHEGIFLRAIVEKGGWISYGESWKKIRDSMAVAERLVAYVETWHKESDVPGHCRECSLLWPCPPSLLAQDFRKAEYKS